MEILVLNLDYLRERAARANVSEAHEILKKAGLAHRPPLQDRLDTESA